MNHVAPGLGRTNEGCTQTSDIQRGRVIAGAIPQTGGIGAAQPGSPVIGLLQVSRRTEGVSLVPTAGTDMRRVARLLPFETNTSEEAFVTEDPPQFSTHLTVITPVSPPPLC